MRDVREMQAELRTAAQRWNHSISMCLGAYDTEIIRAKLAIEEHLGAILEIGIADPRQPSFNPPSLLVLYSKDNLSESQLAISMKKTLPDLTIVAITGGKESGPVSQMAKIHIHLETNHFDSMAAFIREIIFSSLESTDTIKS